MYKKLKNIIVLHLFLFQKLNCTMLSQKQNVQNEKKNTPRLAIDLGELDCDVVTGETKRRRDPADLKRSPRGSPMYRKHQMGCILIELIKDYEKNGKEKTEADWIQFFEKYGLPQTPLGWALYEKKTGLKGADKT